MPNHTSLASLFSDIADAIRAKTGGSAQIAADDFPTAIAGIAAARIGETDATNSSSAQTISFTVSGEPIVYACVPVTNTDVNKTASLGTARIVTGVIKYGNNTYHDMQVGGGSSLALRINQVNATYSNGTFTLSITASNGGNFFGGVKYRLLYVY